MKNYSHLDIDPRNNQNQQLVNFTTAPTDYDYSYNKMLIDNWGSWNGKPLRKLINDDEGRMQAQMMRYQSGNHLAMTAGQINDLVIDGIAIENPREQQIWHFWQTIDFGREFFDTRENIDKLQHAIDELNAKAEFVDNVPSIAISSLDGGYIQWVQVVNNEKLFDQAVTQLQALKQDTK